MRDSNMLNIDCSAIVKHSYIWGKAGNHFEEYRLIHLVSRMCLSNWISPWDQSLMIRLHTEKDGNITHLPQMGPIAINHFEILGYFSLLQNRQHSLKGPEGANHKSSSILQSPTIRVGCTRTSRRIHIQFERAVNFRQCMSYFEIHDTIMFPNDSRN